METTRTAKFRPMLCAQGLWAGRDLYRATPILWHGASVFPVSSEGPPPFSRLIRHTGGFVCYIKPRKQTLKKKKIKKKKKKYYKKKKKKKKKKKIKCKIENNDKITCKIFAMIIRLKENSIKWLGFLKIIIFFVCFATFVVQNPPAHGRKPYHLRRVVLKQLFTTTDVYRAYQTMLAHTV
jgi:hypothetical protein